MNSKHFFRGALAVFLGLALSSCQSRETDFVDQPETGDAPEFYAAIEQPSDTKVYADESLMVLWHADDRVSIFNKYTYNNQYAFQGETGANAGVFKKVPSEDFVTGNALPAIYAIYPYAEGTTISNSCEISLTLPSEQPYAELNFGRGANTMVSATEGNDLLFKNLCGYLAVKLYGDGVSVASVSLKGNNGEKLAGKAVVTAPLDGDPVVALAEDAGTEIWVNCASAVSLGATEDAYTEFWFVIPPTTFSQGFTLTVRDNQGGTFVKRTDKYVTIERNHLSRMSPVQVTPGPPLPQTVRLNASFDMPDTKVAMQEDFKSVLWTPGDRITVFSQNGESAAFVSESAEPSSVTVFTGQLNQYSYGDRLWARYPASNFIFAEGRFAGKMNAVQKAVENRFDPDSQFFVSFSDNESLTFYKACAYLGISVANDDIVSMTIKANNGEVISGGCRVTLYEEGATSLEMIPSEGGSDEILMYDPKGSPFTPDTKYFFTLPPCTLAGGFTLILQNSAGQFASKTTTRTLEMKRNNIYILSVVSNLTFEDFETPGLSIAEISDLPDGTAVSTRPLLVTAKTMYGLMLNDESGDIFLYGRYLEAVVGDRVKIQAVKKTFRGLPEMADMTSCIILTRGNSVSYPQATDLTDLETVDIEDPLFSGFSYVSITASYINASLDVRNYAAYNLRFHGIDPSVNYVRVFYPYDHQDPTQYSADDEISVSGYFGGFDDTNKIVYIIPTAMTK